MKSWSDQRIEQEQRKWDALEGERPQRDVPGPGQESVWDYPRPPRVEPVTAPIRVEFGGIELAQTAAAYRVIETASPPVYYLPPADVVTEYLTPSSHRTMCEWKGVARYWDVRVGERVVTNAAWSYPRPTAAFAVIRDYLAFYAGKMDGCWVGDMQVAPQDGDFYGGWVTPDILGPFKGTPGTEGW